MGNELKIDSGLFDIEFLKKISCVGICKWIILNGILNTLCYSQKQIRKIPLFELVELTGVYIYIYMLWKKTWYKILIDYGIILDY